MHEELDRRIISALSDLIMPISYSDLRNNFNDPDFVERVCYLITTDQIIVPGWLDKSDYPEEVRIINRTLRSYNPEYTRAVSDDDLKQAVYDYLMKGETPAKVEIKDVSEPALLYEPNKQKFLEHLKEQAEKARVN